MGDSEGLKLPKPVSAELLNLSSDRRLDLLGFVRPDEVEQLKAYNMDAVRFLVFKDFIFLCLAATSYNNNNN